MDQFLEMKERGEIIRFSELLSEIPSDDVLLELFPDPQRPHKLLVNHRQLEVLKLRLNGLRLPEISEQLGFTPSQTAYASAMAAKSLFRRIPPYMDADIPALRKLLGMPPKERTGYTKLSELLRDMPSDEELLNLFMERGNTVQYRRKTPPTNQDLQLLQMRSQEQSFAEIGEKVGADAEQVHSKISLTLKRILRDLRIDLDVPALHSPISVYTEQSPVQSGQEDLSIDEDTKPFLCQKDHQRLLVDEKGTMVIEEHAPPPFLDLRPLLEVFYSCGYKFVSDNMAIDLAFSFVGKNISEFKAELRMRAQKSTAAREKRSKSRKDWADHVKRMSNMIIGIESVDLFETGFNVWLMLNTQYSYQHQRSYVQNRHKDILYFMGSELQHSSKRVWRQSSKLMAFAELISVTLTKQNVVQYTYELKEGIQEILKDSPEAFTNAEG